VNDYFFFLGAGFFAAGFFALDFVAIVLFFYGFATLRNFSFSEGLLASWCPAWRL
jgi:hypothetical protein